MRSGNNFGNNCRGRGKGAQYYRDEAGPLSLIYATATCICTYNRIFLRHCQFVSCLGTLYFFWGGGESNGLFRVHKRLPLDPTLIQNTSVHYKNPDAQFLTKVSEKMVFFSGRRYASL